MTDFERRDRVQIDIPDKTDLDHLFHGEHGEILAIIQDDMGEKQAILGILAFTVSG